MKVLNEYPGSHHYWKTYEKCEYFCPVCGKQEVWQEQGPGDYYIGSDYICIACGAKSALDHVSVNKENQPNYAGILEQLRTRITKEPSTKKGG